MAGLEGVELIQEPIASALAAGWSQSETQGYWLVYDLGGGTFDASLLETRDGFLRVVGHDGDNFLGGRDFDTALVDEAIRVFHDDTGHRIERANPAHAGALRKIKQAAEEAKIALSRARVCDICVADLVDGLSLEVPLDRTRLRALTQPLVDRSIAVCQRLLAQHRVSAGALHRVVLVGGPTLIPFLRERVSEVLGAPFGEGLDPMTLVAQGAALFAASVGLSVRPREQTKAEGRPLWLQSPPVSTDLRPHLVGRLVGEQASPPLHSIQASRGDGKWTSETATLDAEGGFVLQLELAPRGASEFTLAGRAKGGQAVAVHPSTFTIVQGLTIGDPPLSRSVGVALSNNRVRVYLERGAPLPARCTFTHHTVDSVVKGAGDFALRIPIVQGEFERADLCRLVGTLEIPGAEVKQTIPAGTAIEVTIDVDRSGRLSARALIPEMGHIFEQVAQLRVPDARPETLKAALDDITRRLQAVRQAARGPGDAVSLLEVELACRSVQSDISAAAGGDADSGQKARRTLQEIDARLDVFEASRSLDHLQAEAREAVVWATDWVSSYGTSTERTLLDELSQSLQRARSDGDSLEMQRCISQARRLGHAAYFRDPQAWGRAFDTAASQVHKARNLPHAQRLVAEGHEARRRDDREALRRVTEGLWSLLPDNDHDRQASHDSGVR